MKIVKKKFSHRTQNQLQAMPNIKESGLRQLFNQPKSSGGLPKVSECKSEKSKIWPSWIITASTVTRLTLEERADSGHFWAWLCFGWDVLPRPIWTRQPWRWWLVRFEFSDSRNSRWNFVRQTSSYHYSEVNGQFIESGRPLIWSLATCTVASNGFYWV